MDYTDKGEQLRVLLHQLEQRLNQQAQAIVAKHFESVVRLSVECADICQQLKPLLVVFRQDTSGKVGNAGIGHCHSAEIYRLLRSCQTLQQSNRDALARLTRYCDAFMDVFRGLPLSYGKNSNITYPSGKHSLCKL